MKKLKLILNLLFSTLLVFSFLLQTPSELITLIQGQSQSRTLSSNPSSLTHRTRLEFQRKIGSPLFLRISDTQDLELDDEASRMNLDLSFVTGWIHYPIALILSDGRAFPFHELSPFCLLSRMGDRFSILHAGNSPPTGSLT